jgi:hypothetical protein
MQTWMQIGGFFALIEVVFVVGFAALEAIHFVARRRLALADRALDAIPEDRWITHYYTPMITGVSTILAGVGITLMYGGAGVRGLILGVCILGGSLFMLLSVLLRDATGNFPRPPARTRLRRSAAEIQRALEAGVPLSRPDAARLRMQLRRMGLLGDRLTNRASASRWPEVIRGENRWVATLVAVAMALPIATALTLLTIDITNDTDWVKILRQILILLGLSAFALIGADLRRRRHRYQLDQFGRELRSESGRLLAYLAEMTIPQRPNRAPRSHFQFLLRHIRWWYRSSAAWLR